MDVPDAGSADDRASHTPREGRSGILLVDRAAWAIGRPNGRGCIMDDPIEPEA